MSRHDDIARENQESADRDKLKVVRNKKKLKRIRLIEKEYQRDAGNFGNWVWVAYTSWGWRFVSGAHMAFTRTKAELLTMINDPSQTEPCRCSDCMLEIRQGTSA